MKPILRFLFAFALCLGTGGVSALVAYDTLGPENAYRPDTGWSFGPSSYMTAVQFTAAQTGELSMIEFAVGMVVPAETKRISGVILADSDGQPGTVLDGVIVDTPNQPGQPWAGILGSTGFSDVIVLNEGSKYWVGVGSNLMEGNWLLSTSTTTGLVAHSADASIATWSPAELGLAGAVRIEVSPVPEPNASLLLIAGLFAILPFAMRGRQRACPPRGYAIVGVPA